jgi:hypothetical protein
MESDTSALVVRRARERAASTFTAVAVMTSVGLGGCGETEREAGETERAYVERLQSECVEEHSGDVNHDETISGCLSEAVASAVERGDLPASAQKAVNRGDLDRLDE